jgi:hypothetical protein
MLQSMKLIDMTGQRHGHVTVLRHVGLDKANRALWECRCDCGKLCTLSRAELAPDKHRSCGCQRWHGNRKATGHSHTTTYRVWLNMVARCYHTHHEAYARYGERGITICDEWRNDYLNFLGDMGDKPQGMQLERVDNNGPYTKANCKWATPKEQSQNRRSNLMLTINGETLCATEWARRAGFKTAVVMDRVRRGWPAERLLEPLKYNAKP